MDTLRISCEDMVYLISCYQPRLKHVQPDTARRWLQSKLRIKAVGGLRAAQPTARVNRPHRYCPYYLSARGLL